MSACWGTAALLSRCRQYKIDRAADVCNLCITDSQRRAKRENIVLFQFVEPRTSDETAYGIRTGSGAPPTLPCGFSLDDPQTDLANRND
jgi:hypothetical protein